MERKDMSRSCPRAGPSHQVGPAFGASSLGHVPRAPILLRGRCANFKGGTSRGMWILDISSISDIRENWPLTTMASKRRRLLIIAEFQN